MKASIIASGSTFIRINGRRDTSAAALPHRRTDAGEASSPKGTQLTAPPGPPPPALSTAAPSRAASPAGSACRPPPPTCGLREYDGGRRGSARRGYTRRGTCVRLRLGDCAAAVHGGPQTAAREPSAAGWAITRRWARLHAALGVAVGGGGGSGRLPPDPADVLCRDCGGVAKPAATAFALLSPTAAGQPPKREGRVGVLFPTTKHCDSSTQPSIFLARQMYRLGK